jgi:phage baseplate assembly protein W
MNSPVGDITLRSADTGEAVPQTSNGWVDFGATGEAEIWQCIKYILLTSVRSVVEDRDFGMDFTMIDKPMNIAQLLLTQEILMKINLFEPRARFDDVAYSGNGVEGRLEPNITVKLLVTT